MKIKPQLIFLIIFAFSIVGFSQNAVVITPKKTVYVRKGRDTDESKRTFEIRYPIVSGSIASAVKRNLENTISYWRVFETTLKESMEESFLSSLDYKVNYDKKGVFDISLIQEGVGAYPSTETANLVIDLKSGEQAKFDEVFEQNSLDKLAKLVDAKLAIEKKQIIKSIDADKTNYDSGDGRTRDADKQTVNDLKFTTENFNQFSVSDKGVTILYDAGFPHVNLALQPEGRYFFSWAQIKPFVRRGGLLARFVR